MTCATLRTHSSVSYHAPFQSQYLSSSPFLDIHPILSGMVETSSDKCARAVYKSRLLEEFNTSQAFRSQVLTFFDYVVSLKRNRMAENDWIHQLPFSCVDPTEPSVASGNEDEASLTASLSRSRPRSHSASSSRKSLTHIPHPIPGRRTTLLPPRPRLSSPLTPHPHAPQNGPNLRRPIPKKRHRAEQPLIRQAVFNCSNVARKPSSQFDPDPDTRDHHSLDHLEDHSELELRSSWIDIPLPPDDWELIWREELDQ